MPYTYDFGLSFSGNDRQYAKELADLLKSERVKVFYDHDEKAELWGQDLYQKFHKVYGKECRFFIPFISKSYIEKEWPRHELKQAQARDFKSDSEYILPLRIDDTELPGLNDTTGYIDLRQVSIKEVSELCLRKLVKDCSVRKLFMFLRERNPDFMNLIEHKSESILIRVSTSRSLELERILAQLDRRICSGSDHHNILLNGGFGPPGCIGSIDPEPHTTFTLNLTPQFYSAINA